MATSRCLASWARLGSHQELCKVEVQSSGRRLGATGRVRVWPLPSPGRRPGPAPHHGPCLTVARQCPIGSPTDPRARPWSKILQVVADYRGAVLEASVQTMLKIKVESRVGVTLRL